jgi:tol-pal system protein YbgF
MITQTLRVPLVAVVLALAVQSASAALFDDEEARKRIADTNVRLAQIQRQLEDRLLVIEQQLKSGGLVELAGQLDAARSDVARLRGQIEVLTHELNEAQKRQRDLYVDLDSRMRRIETAQAEAATSQAAAATPAKQPPAESATPGGVAGTVPPGATPPRDPAAEQRAYDAALDLFKRGDYNGAIQAFGSFVRTYPRTPLASSAQYWIGNAHFARRDFRAAITAQRTLIANYPDSAKVPDALFNIASAQGELGDTAGARRTLEELMAKYPQSEAAAKAKQRLAGR